MTAPVILVDTSVWIGYLRGDERPAVDRFAAYLDRGVPVAVAPVVAQELLQGVADEREAERLGRYLATQPRLEPADPWAAAVAAAELYRRCRASGVTVRSAIGCQLAQLAIEHGAPLLHDDRDLDAIARVVPELQLA